MGRLVQHQICHPDFQAKVTQWQFKQSTMNTRSHRISPNVSIETRLRSFPELFKSSLHSGTRPDIPSTRILHHWGIEASHWKSSSWKVTLAHYLQGFTRIQSQVVQNFHEFLVWNWNSTAYALSANHCLWEKASSSSMLWNHCVRVHGVQPPGPQITGSWLHLSIGAMALVLSVRMDHECKS